MPDAADLEQHTTEYLQRLIRFNTVNPPGNEEPAILWLKDRLEAAGFECELLARTAGRPNLLARLPGRSDGPRLCYLSHVDTVLANPAEWSADPWGGEIRDGCVWGRGALDMKSQTAAEVVAAIALAEEGWRPESGELMVLVVVDEEAGSADGAKWLCREHPDKVRSDYVINEGGGDVFEYGGKRHYGVCVAEKGVFRFTLRTRGRAGHASIPRIGDNALKKMAPLIERLSTGRPTLELSPEPEAFMRALGAPLDGDLEASLAAVEKENLLVAILLEPLLGVTVAPTMISASQKINVIPSAAELKVDCRVPPGLGADHARMRVEELLGEGEYEIEFNESTPGNRSPIETPLMDEVRAFVAEEDPEADVVPIGLPGYTDSQSFRAAFPGCVAYGWFPQREMSMFEAAPLVHGADERIPISDLGLAARFYARLAPNLLGG
jgi:acetylornithine deacetylase/succinyl-diaminopimelate desuccinylase-like protein